MNELLAWLKFEVRFKREQWTPTREDWLQHQKDGRELLLLALSELPGVSNEQIEHAQHYVDPVQWNANDFLERVIAIAINCYRRK